MSITDNRTDETREIVEELGKELDALDAGKWDDLTHIDACAHVMGNMAPFMGLVNSRLRELGVIAPDELFCITVEKVCFEGDER